MGSEFDWLIGRRLTVGIVLAISLLSAAPPSFDNDVRPVLAQVCQNCHNPQVESGNLNITKYLEPSSLSSEQAGWTKILARLKAGEMPPPGVPGPSPSAMATLIRFVQSTLNETLAPDAGRVVAHRLNREEYSNTVRDLLGVDFAADEEFPADDSGYGFDNIGDVLTSFACADAGISGCGGKDRGTCDWRRCVAAAGLRQPAGTVCAAWVPA